MLNVNDSNHHPKTPSIHPKQYRFNNKDTKQHNSTQIQSVTGWGTQIFDDVGWGMDLDVEVWIYDNNVWWIGVGSSDDGGWE